MSAKRFSDDEVEAFCQAFVRSGNQAGSVREAFAEARDWPSEKAGKKAWRLMQTARCRSRIHELQRAASLISLAELLSLARVAAAADTDPAVRRMASRVVAAGLADLVRRAQAGESMTEVAVPINATVGDGT